MCTTCAHYEVTDQINEMLDDGNYDFAADTLQDIGKWIARHQHVTDGQRDAVYAIERKGDKDANEYPEAEAFRRSRR